MKTSAGIFCSRRPSMLSPLSVYRLPGPIRVHFPCFLSFVLILFACAQEGAPPGGPPDTFGPNVIGLSPPNGTTLVAPDISPVITFNERVDFRSLEDAVFIVPLIPFRFKSNWDGDEITIKFDKPLEMDRTYVITLGTNIRDMRSNRLSSAVVYSFSTGAVIDQGEITGVVAFNNQPVEGAYVWAYSLRLKPEPDPAKMPPDYIVQTGDDGTFRFTNLSLDTYRVFAFRDQSRDRRYDVGSDPLGVSTEDAILSEDRLSYPTLRFQLSVRDTTGMYINAVRAAHNRQAGIRLSKSVPAETASDISRYRIVDVQRGDTLEVLSAYRDEPDTSSIILQTASQTAGATYRLTIGNLIDFEDVLIDSTAGTAEFIGSSNEDAARPGLKSVWPPENMRNVPLQPEIRLVFDEAVTLAADAATLVDTLGRTTPLALRRPSPATAVLQPESALLPAMYYTFHILINRVRDLADLPLKPVNSESDSISNRFQTVDPAIYGMMTGTVVDEDSLATGAVYIFITDQDNRNNTYQTRIPAPGVYRFPEIIPGKYTLSAYRDANDNGRFDYGTPIPFRPAERSVAYPDTLPIRSGWESEGIDLRFRR